MLLKNKGVLGINARNLLYIRPYNKKKAIKLADDKIKTKQFLAARDIPVPKLYKIIKDLTDLEKFDFNSLPNTFVLKPNQGFGGEGIIPITDKKYGYFITAGNRQISKEEMKDHIIDILDGRFSITNVRDYAFFEQYIVSDERIAKYSYEGLPDIRIVVHNLIPVMAMLRLPTKESEGKANLHMGATGIGIDIAKGEATYITYKNKIIEELPDGLGKIRGFKIPYWDEILLIASKVQLITNLGYMAVDICIDKNIGPVLLEINARAGLGVQIANLAPLRKRLERIEGVKVMSPIKGVRIAKDMFGNTVEKEIKQVSGKQVIATEEKVEIIQKKGTFIVLAKIDTGRQISVIDEDLADKNGLLDDLENYDDEKSTLKLKFSVKNKRIQTVVEVEKISNKDHKMILGSRDLKDFLIDTSVATEQKTPSKTEKIKDYIFGGFTKKINYSEIDQDLVRIDNKIKLLYHLRPINLISEQEKFFKTPDLNPNFEYPELKFNPIELVDALNKIKTDDSPLGILFQNKQQELSNKIRLLEAIDEEEFTDISIALFGRPSQEDLINCENYLKNLQKEGVFEPSLETLFSAEEAKIEFEKIFAKYNLNNWKVSLKENLVADCVAGKNNRLFVKSKTLFSKKRIEALIVHEIETHILTAENGKNQPYEIFNRGLANYLITQEGLAVYNVEKELNEPFNKNYKIFANVIAIHKGLQSSFVEIFKKLSALGLSQATAFRAALKAKRGFSDTGRKGAFTKDYIYYQGYFEIKNFVNNGGNIEDLYLGKLNLQDLKIIKGIPGVNKAKLLPTWLK